MTLTNIYDIWALTSYVPVSAIFITLDSREDVNIKGRALEHKYTLLGNTWPLKVRTTVSMATNSVLPLTIFLLKRLIFKMFAGTLIFLLTLHQSS